MHGDHADCGQAHSHDHGEGEKPGGIAGFIVSSVPIKHRETFVRVIALAEQSMPNSAVEIVPASDDSRGEIRYAGRTPLLEVSATESAVIVSFQQGGRFFDPYDLLDGSGRKARVVKITTKMDFPDAELQHCLEEAVRVDQED